MLIAPQLKRNVGWLFYMDAHDYPIEHFRMMGEISGMMKSLGALLLEHAYNYESFGSWWIVFKRAGKKFRVVFDAKDGCLTLESAIIARRAKIVHEWQSVELKQLSNVSSDRIASEVRALVSSL